MMLFEEGKYTRGNLKFGLILLSKCYLPGVVTSFNLSDIIIVVELVNRYYTLRSKITGIQST